MTFEINVFLKKRHSVTSGKLFLLAAALLLLGAGMQFTNSVAAEGAVKVPPPALDMVASAQGAEEKAVFAGGCFWVRPSLPMRV